ncbi:SusC/RagA family TonB-linked outer membrane protein [Leeuwenhoekiella marinoflava]|uniref:SusC/RagA family TonB-linked outer membrane protein n=1 Tax=Leeuwenhoekiella marinoflava TaxID=988 RepID=UPI003002ECBA
MKNKTTHLTGVALPGLLCLLMSLSALWASASPLQQQVTGRVTDTNDNPIPGVSISLTNSTTGTQTDMDGAFELVASPQDTLRISYIGFKTLLLPVGNQTTFTIVLRQDITDLGEVTINAGYYNTTERERTGSIARVSGEEIEMQPIVSPLEALQGRMAGVEIQQRDGMPGNAPIIRIRGRNSLREDGNYPLYIIDGVPINSTPIAVGALLEDGMDPLSTLNLSNIESIEVLKDADATAIYGSRGANGVLLITTKKGAGYEQKTTIETRWYSGGGQIEKKVKLLNTQQYVELREEAITNSGREPDVDNDWDLLRWDTQRHTDWQEVLLGGTAAITDVNISASGGTATTSFRIGGSFHKQGSVLPIDMDYKKVTTALSLNHTSEDKKLRINVSANYGVDKTNSTITYSILPLAYELPPNAPPLYNTDGSLHWEEWTYSDWDNPLAEKYNPSENNVQNLIANMGISYEVYKGLEIKANLGYTQNIREGKSQRFMEGVSPENRDNAQHRASQMYRKRLSWIVEPQLEYHTILGKGTLDALIGATFQQNESDGFSISGQGYVTESLVGYMPAAETVSAGTNQLIRYRYNALFGRIGYNWDKKYYINLTGRRDGSSRFGPGKRFSNFGAIGAAWIFTEEKFMKNHGSFFSFGKLRGSYGITGSDQIGDYQYLDAYEATGVPGGLYPTQLFNADFAWEENKKLEAGMELAFIQNRINFGLSWYRNRSSNQLVGYPLAATTGFSSVQANLPATVQNMGWEVELSSINIRTKDFRWQTSFNISLPKNKLVRFPNIDQTAYAQQYRVGHPLNISLRYKFDGIDPETGYYQVVDVNGDESYTYEDRMVIKNMGRKYYGGVSNNFTYKGWRLNFLWDFVKQHGYAWGRGYPGRNKTNRSYEEYKAWQNGALYIEDSSVANNTYNLARESELGIVDASFIRLKTLSLSYHLPAKWLEKTGVKSCNVFASVQNLVTITPYNGINVENPRFPGTLPPLRTFTGGIQLAL